MPAGADLDSLIHQQLLKESAKEAAPQYSSDERLSPRVKAAITRRFGYAVVVGRTRRAPGRFARLETGPSTATEALAESEPLALCRLAAVLLARHG
jgi:hypothetical protein